MGRSCIAMKNKQTILLCDDDEFLSRMYAYKLENEGYKVVVVNSGEKVVPQAKVIMPDIIILDLIMPIMDGFDVLAELQREDSVALKKIPVIVASNLAQEADIITVKKLGAVDFVVKLNTTPKDLVDTVKKYLQNM